jgi:hypothetical protein
LLRKRADLVVSIGLLLLIAWMVWDAQQWSLRARLFPWTIGIPAVGLALLQVVFAARNMLTATAAPEAEHAPSPAAPPPTLPAVEQKDEDAAVVAAAVESAFGAGSAAAEEEAIPPAVSRRRTIQMSLWILAFAFSTVLLGFRLGAGLTTFAFLRWGAHESWKTTILIAVATYLSFWLIFDVGLNTPFPAGILADALNVDAFDSVITDPIKRLITSR